MKNCELGGKRAKHDKTDLTSLQKIWATIFSLLPSSSSCSPSEPCPAPGVEFENKIRKCETHPSWSSTALHLFHHVLKTTHACRITFSQFVNMGVVNSSGMYLPSVSAHQGRSSSTFVDSTEPSGLVQPRWWVKEQDGADQAPVGSYCLPWKVPLYLPSSSPPSKEANYSLILPGKKLLQASLHKSHLCKFCILLQQLLHLLF